MSKTSLIKKHGMHKTKIVIISSSTIVALILLSLGYFVPLDSVRVGECPASTVRLSLVSGGMDKMDKAKEQATELRLREAEENSKQAGGVEIFRGCSSTEPEYKLYVL